MFFVEWDIIKMYMFYIIDYTMALLSHIDAFKQLPYQEKRNIAMNIITNLKDRGNTQAQEIYDYVSTLETIPDSLLESIYQDFEISVEKIKKERISDQLHVFDTAQASIAKIREREAQERVQENSESILEQI